MKRLAVFDFDGTLINTPDKLNGMELWKEKNGQPYPHKGWWGRRESLDTTLFDIKPFPHVLAQLEKEKAIPDTSVIILTSRMEKLRPEVEKILDMNNIVVDDVILKRGNEGKGDVILKIENYNPELREIVVYDDFMDRNAEKIAEYTKIKDQLSPEIKYILYYVDNDTIRPLVGEGKITFESTNKLLKMIREEINKVFSENVVALKTPIIIYHGGDPSNLKALMKNPTILPPEEKMKLPSNTGGYLIGLSTSKDINNAKKYSNGFRHSKVLKMELNAGANVININTEGAGIDEIYTGDDLEALQKHGVDAIIELDDNAEKEVRILNSKHLKVIGVI